jgi:hypothetical protein
VCVSYSALSVLARRLATISAPSYRLPPPDGIPMTRQTGWMTGADRNKAQTQGAAFEHDSRCMNFHAKHSEYNRWFSMLFRQAAPQAPRRGCVLQASTKRAGYDAIAHRIDWPYGACPTKCNRTQLLMLGVRSLQLYPGLHTQLMRPSLTTTRALQLIFMFSLSCSPMCVLITSTCSELSPCHMPARRRQFDVWYASCAAVRASHIAKDTNWLLDSQSTSRQVSANRSKSL